MRPFTRSLAFVFPVLLASQLVAAQTHRQQTVSVPAHSIYGTPPAEQDMLPMPLVAPVFLQTDQIDSAITVVNSIVSP